MVISKIKDQFRIEFEFTSSWHSIVEYVKEIPGRQFDSPSKCWFIPISQQRHIENLVKRFGFTCLPERKCESVGDIPPLPELTVSIPLAREPYSYQKSGIAYCLEKKRCIVGDKPGLGKTGQAIGAIIGAKSFPCLIICPATLKINWEREIDIWSGGQRKALILDDRNKNKWHLCLEAKIADFIIVNYESLAKYFVESIPSKKRLIKLNTIVLNQNSKLFKSVIIDESHRIKNGGSLQSKLSMLLSQNREFRLMLTGTPVVNNPADIIPQLMAMGRLGEFGGYKDFISRYCEGGRGACNLKELNYKLSLSCFYQREKADVLKDLPAKTRQTIICDIATRKEYTDAERNLISYLRQYKNATDGQVRRAMKGEVIVTINVLRQIAARGKVKAVKEFLDDMMEQGEKVILFMNLIELGDKFKELYPTAVVIRGGISMEGKQIAIDRFQKDPDCKLAICNIKAAGVGITLTSASNVAFVEFPWTYADCEQCEDRAHRIGQKDNVTCFYFLGRKTIDERMYQIIQAKKGIAAQVTGSTEEVEESMVDMLANLFDKD